MEDSFKVRVDKIFGSLPSSTSTTPSSSSLSSLWSLTDAEIERREWIRDKGSPQPETDPFPSFFENRPNGPEDKPIALRNEHEKDLHDLDDDLDEEPRFSRSCSKPDDYGDEEWEIKSSIGLDCTLDYEEEEDEYDKVAVGEEKTEDRLYMKDVEDYGIEIDSSNVIPISTKEFIRDPRANHLAAKVRLKEDAEAAKRIDSLQVTENGSVASGDAEFNTSENPKSILKRKDDLLASKPQKRVRFDPECKISSDQEETKESNNSTLKQTCSSGAGEVSKEASFLAQGYQSGVPDYVRNPSKYTHYTFDSSTDMDELSNKQAYMDFLKLVKGSHTIELEPNASRELPKSVTFIPKKKSGDSPMPEIGAQTQDGMGREELMPRRGMPISITAENTEETEVCAMEEDEPDKSTDKRGDLHRGISRQYRTRAKAVESEEC